MTFAPAVEGHHRNDMPGDLGSGPEALTARECEVLEAMIHHGVIKLAAQTLGMHRDTARNHLTAVRLKLGVGTTAQAMALYERSRRVPTWPEVDRRHHNRRHGPGRRASDR